METENLCYLSAVEILEQFRTRELSPVEYLDTLISRIEKVNPFINALADQYIDEARNQASIAESRYLGKGEAPRPLEGLPVAIKDAQRVAGKRTTHGSLLFTENIEHHSDPMVERLQDAGAIIHTRTTTPEFCLSGTCNSRLWGNTLNPFNRKYGPGGSSGGSAAALAAGITPIATGTDIGGSVRIPAACCGVIGYKPPHGRNPDGPPANFDRYNHCGPLTRSVSDAGLIQNIVSGIHSRDHDSLPESVKISTEVTSIKGLKIAWSMDFGYFPIDSQVRKNTMNALEVFRDLGAQLEEVDLGWSSKCDEAAMHWYNAMHFGRQAKWHAVDHADDLTDYALATINSLKHTSLDDMARSWEVQHEMYQTFGPIMERSDVFICPTTALPALKADHDTLSTNFRVDGKVVDPEYGWILTHHFNMLHYCPVISVPSGFANNNVPTGIQIVGRTFDDQKVFTAARAFEASVGGWFNNISERPVF